MAERPQPRGFDVNQPGSTRETFTGLAQGATTDLVGSVVDLGAAATGIASQVDPRLLAMSPTASLLSYLNPFAEQAQEVAGSEALGQRVFGDAPTEDLQKIRDDARLVGGVAGLGEMLTAKGATTVAGGIEDFMRFLPNVRAQAVTPEGSMLPLPDTSVTEMLASADTPGMNPKYVEDLKKAESNAQKRLEDGEDPRKVFEETGFMRINVDARPGRDVGGEPLETKMVFDVPDNLSQIKVSNLLPESVAKKVEKGASSKQVMDAFERLKDPKNYFVEQFYRGGKYGRSVQFNLDQVIGEDHPILDVFPDLGKEINVRFVEKLPKDVGGHWNSSTNTIAIGAQYLKNDRYTSTLMVHELAHLLQTRGDLPGGSSRFMVKEGVSGKLFDNFALFETTKTLAEPNNTRFNPYEFFNELRPKEEARNLERLVGQARLNVKNANPEAPDNLSRMWPGNTNSTSPINLDEMPYRDEVLAEMYRLVGEKEAKAFKEAEAFQALGINIYRGKDEAAENYMKTRGEFMARLQEAYALATEGLPPNERRKLFPMDVAIKGARATKEAPGGDTGAALEYTKEISPGVGVMRGTGVKSFDTEGAERGLVDVEGLINLDKLPENIKKKIEYPNRKPASTAPKSTGLLGGDKPQRFYHGTGETFKDFDPNAKYTFVSSEPRVANFFAQGTFEGSPNIRPVYLKDANFFDPKNPAHLESLAKSDWYKSNRRKLRKHPFDRTFLKGEGRGSLRDDYNMIEATGLDNALQEMGYDGFATYEMGAKNLAVFNVDNIVSGVQKKAEGGVITLADVARNMSRGPRGVASLAPVARNMNRPMVS